MVEKEAPVRRAFPLTMVVSTNQQNWEICKEHRVWGVRLDNVSGLGKAKNLRSGDYLVVWISGQGFTAIARATGSPEQPWPETIPVPWHDGSEYGMRIPLEVEETFDPPVSLAFKGAYAPSLRLNKNSLFAYGHLDDVQLERIRQLSRGEVGETTQLQRAWIVLQGVESEYEDEEGVAYNYPLDIPNAKQIEVGDVLVCYRPGRGSEAKKIFGIGLVVYLAEHEASHRRTAIYSHYLALKSPVGFEEIGGDPRANRQHSISPSPMALVKNILEREGLENLRDAPVVETEKNVRIHEESSQVIHLVLKWNADREPQTINLHREVAEREGSVWWGRFSKNDVPRISAARLRQLQEQIQIRPTHAYLYRRGSVWRATVEEATLERPSVDDPRFPSYYLPSDANFFVRLSNWQELQPGWLEKNAVLANYPNDSNRLSAALGNQTNPLFIYERGQAGEDADGSTDEQVGAIDISGVTLQDVTENVALRLKESGLQYGPRHDQFIRSALVSLATKRFLLLTGLSGSGKTRLGIAIGEWFGENNWLLIPVRPDWTGPDALFGFENALSQPVKGRHAWTTPESLEFMLRAARDPGRPYLLLLDEMNLAHVERYFADALSGIESQSPVVPNLFRESNSWYLGDPPKLPFPKNVFVVGTVNIDETTYMFSPKVLDRANTLEFRVETADLETEMKPLTSIRPGPDRLVRKFLVSATSPVEEEWEGSHVLSELLRELHSLLSTSDREFGHRAFLEARRFGALLADAGEADPLVALDLQVLQKVLPRFHGSIREISDPLSTLGAWCWFGPSAPEKPSPSFDPLTPPGGSPRLPKSFDKIARMTRRLRANHFVGFAE